MIGLREKELDRHKFTEGVETQVRTKDFKCFLLI